MMGGDERDTRRADAIPESTSDYPPVVRAGDTAAGPAHADSPTRPAIAIPGRRRVGRYTLGKEIGRGGMGVVYLAHQEDLNRDVALKVIQAGPDADPVELARFQAEAETAANLYHPNIVQVYEVGEGDGVAFLAMEYVDGGTLHQKVSKQPMRPRDAARLLEPVARAVHYAHQHGVIHRDLKPSNVLLQSPESAVNGLQSTNIHRVGSAGPGLGTPKIADFGLAKRLNKSLSLTQTGIAVGTPHYMAPEQARGQADKVGPLTDVYGLGAILYEMLIGHPPFGGGSSMETMEQVVNKRPVPPGHLRDGIPKDLEEICLRCLEKTPAKRFPSAEALADALRQFLTAGHTSPLAVTPLPVPVTPAAPVAAPPPMRRSVWPLVAGALLFGAAMAVGAMWLGGALNRAPKAETAGPSAEELDAIRADARLARQARLAETIRRCEQGQIEAALRDFGATTTAEADVLEPWKAHLLNRVEVPATVGATAVAIDPTRRFVVVATGQRISLWDFTARTVLWADRDAGSPVTALAWSGDGNSLAAGTESGTATVWTASNGTARAQIKAGKDPIQSVAFAADGTALIAADGIAVWKSALIDGTAKPMADAPVTHKTPLPRAVHAAGLVAGETPDGRFAVYDPANPAMADARFVSPGPLATLAFSPAGTHVVAVTKGGSVSIFDRADGQWLDLPADRHATAAAFSQDGNVIAVGTQAGTVRLWDAIARAPLTDAVALPHPVVSIAVDKGANGGYVVAAVTVDRQVHMYRCGAWPFVSPPLRLDNEPGKEVLGLAFDAEGTRLFVTSPSGVSRWNVRTGERISADREYSSAKRFAGAGGRFCVGCVRPAKGDRGETFLVGGTGGRLFAVDTLKDENAAPTQIDGAEQLTAVAVSSEGVSAAGRTKEGRGVVAYWSAAGEKAKRQEFPSDVNQEAFADSSRLVLACEDGNIRIWDLKVEKLEIESFACGSPVLCVVASEDGKTVLAGCADGTAQLWSLESGKRLAVFRHRGEVRGVAFYRGRPLTASADGTVRRWHADLEVPVGPPLRHPDAVSALAVSKQGLVATGGRDRYVRIWRLQ